MKRFLAGAFVVALVAVAATLALLRYRKSPADDAAALVPARAAAYVNVFLRPSTEQRRALRDFLDAFPVADTDQEASEVIGALADGALGRVGLSFGADVQPWAGDQLAGFVLPAAPDEEPAGALLIAAEDERRARAAMAAALARPNAPLLSRSYRGHPYELAGDMAAALVEGFVVVGREHGLRAAIAASEGASLADEDPYRAALAGLEGRRLGLVYLNGSPLPGVAGTTPLQLLGRGSAAIVSARADALVAEASSAGGPALSSTLLALLLQNHGRLGSPEAAASFLDDGYGPVAYLRGDRVGDVAGDILPAVPEVRAFIERLSYVAIGTREEGDRFFVQLVLGAE
jgi:hypothetical protein